MLYHNGGYGGYYICRMGRTSASGYSHATATDAGIRPVVMLKSNFKVEDNIIKAK